MANKPKPPEKVKEVVILFRVTKLEKARIIAKAHRRGCKNISEYLRQLINEDKAKRQMDVIC
jgi:hypothetical protein